MLYPSLESLRSGLKLRVSGGGTPFAATDSWAAIIYTNVVPSAKPCQFIDPPQCLPIWTDFRRLSVFINSFSAAFSRNWEDVFALVLEQGKSKLNERKFIFSMESIL
jgi:hypothetical protein